MKTYQELESEIATLKAEKAELVEKRNALREALIEAMSFVPEWTAIHDRAKSAIAMGEKEELE